MSKSRPLSTSNVASWFQRKAQLQTLLGNCGDDEEEGIALDRILHGNPGAGATPKTVEIENLRFSDKDLSSFGPLADAQFGTVELVNCRLDGRVYVRKRISKKFALKNREQCSPQHERHILLLALKSQSRHSSSWAPHMLCAYQCSSFLNIVMEYAAGGSLWDILESCTDGRLATSDLAWWAPQCVSAIAWLHSRSGFVHRDIKPHNFVVRRGLSPQLLLIDFGSAAPLLKPRSDGVQYVPRSHCLVPCGTCDYISPEILQAHEEALVALEFSDDECERDTDSDSDAQFHGHWKKKGEKKILQGDIGYGCETDWWSLGVMIYELAYGIAPFFANDIRQTYARIINHESNLAFDDKIHVSPTLISLLKGLLTHHERRLGRHSADELRTHPYFKNVDWSNLHSRKAPPGLLLPEFTYAVPLLPPEPEDDKSESSDVSKPFAFSALFQSSVTSKPDASSFQSNQQDAPATPAFGRHSLSRDILSKSAQRSIASFIGFSWGPPKDAFDDATRIVPAEPASAEAGLGRPLSNDADTVLPQYPPITPKRPSHSTVPPSTVRVTSVRRSAQSRPVSDREAMRVLVNCVGQSARKRVLESGKKPKVLLPQFGFGSLKDSFGKGRPRAPSFSRFSPHISSANAVRKELRFDETAPQIMPNLSYTNTFTTTLSNSGLSGSVIPYAPAPYYSASESGTMSEMDGPPSPSPSPRPGSAMSVLSISRRSGTPTVSSAFLIGASVHSSSGPPEPRLRKRSGSLGSLNASANTVAEVDAKEIQPRRARFADSPASSPGPRKERLPGTPHPKGRKTGAKEQQAPRRAKFADLSDPPVSANALKERVPGTPHPRARKKTENEGKAAPRARFLDDSANESSEVVKKRVPSTPHPNGREHEARRNSKPPLQARPLRAMTSTPARPGARSTKTTIEDYFEDRDDDSVRLHRPNMSIRRSPESERERNDEVQLSGEETETPFAKEVLQEGRRSPSILGVSGDLDSYHEEGDELGLHDSMERRYKRLLSDIANLSLHIDDFASRVRSAN